ncbi:YxeA family protein [Bacillus haynesii]|uniref:YxeA family protein n=1 Tax=Bacillus haynesii TaxID=1925021 RepID=UPI00227F3E90|nr:YxeA family protein [Bacillus haynesii]MCY7863005.1 YxeA family protein [Bacillus haynesii]
MKWFLGILTAGLIILGAGYFLYSGYYSTEDYYVKITTDPKVVKEKASDGYTYINYNYDVTGYDKGGKPKSLKLSSQDKMQKGQYYIIHWEDRREIISSKEKANEKQIDKDILDKLNSQIN